LNKSTTNIPSECRSANIVRDHAMILPDDATPKSDGIFGKDNQRRLRSSTAMRPSWRRSVPPAWRSSRRPWILKGLKPRIAQEACELIRPD
jgi:hypothetical protein